jgi:hypothetical protein
LIRCVLAGPSSPEGAKLTVRGGRFLLSGLLFVGLLFVVYVYVVVCFSFRCDFLFSSLLSTYPFRMTDVQLARINPSPIDDPGSPTNLSSTGSKPRR